MSNKKKKACHVMKWKDLEWHLSIGEHWLEIESSLAATNTPSWVSSTPSQASVDLKCTLSSTHIQLEQASTQSILFQSQSISQQSSTLSHDEWGAMYTTGVDFLFRVEGLDGAFMYSYRGPDNHDDDDDDTITNAEEDEPPPTSLRTGGMTTTPFAGLSQLSTEEMSDHEGEDEEDEDAPEKLPPPQQQQGGENISWNPMTQDPEMQNEILAPSSETQPSLLQSPRPLQDDQGSSTDTDEESSLRKKTIEKEKPPLEPTKVAELHPKEKQQENQKIGSVATAMPSTNNKSQGDEKTAPSSQISDVARAPTINAQTANMAMEQQQSSSVAHPTMAKDDTASNSSDPEDDLALSALANQCVTADKPAGEEEKTAASHEQIDTTVTAAAPHDKTGETDDDDEDDDDTVANYEASRRPVALVEKSNPLLLDSQPPASSKPPSDTLVFTPDSSAGEAANGEELVDEDEVPPARPKDDDITKAQEQNPIGDAASITHHAILNSQVVDTQDHQASVVPANENNTKLNSQVAVDTQTSATADHQEKEHDGPADSTKLNSQAPDIQTPPPEHQEGKEHDGPASSTKLGSQAPDIQTPREQHKEEDQAVASKAIAKLNSQVADTQSTVGNQQEEEKQPAPLSSPSNLSILGAVAAAVDSSGTGTITKADAMATLLKFKPKQKTQGASMPDDNLDFVETQTSTFQSQENTQTSNSQRKSERKKSQVPTSRRSTRKRKAGEAEDSQETAPESVKKPAPKKQKKSGRQKPVKAAEPAEAMETEETKTPAKKPAPKRQKRSRRRETTEVAKEPTQEDVRILVTGVQLTAPQKKIITQLGGTLIEDLNEYHTVTHIIVTDGQSSIRRTPKLMIALCRTLNVVSLSWLLQSASANTFLPCDDFVVVKDKKAEAEYKFSMVKTIAVLRDRLQEERYLLSGWSVFICSGVAGKKAPVKKELKKIVESAGGVWLEKLVDAARVLIITSDPETKSQVSKAVAEAIRQGAHKRTTTWLFRATFTQTTDLPNA